MAVCRSREATTGPWLKVTGAHACGQPPIFFPRFPSSAPKQERDEITWKSRGAVLRAPDLGNRCVAVDYSMCLVQHDIEQLDA